MTKKAAITKQALSGRSQVEVAREFVGKQMLSDYMKNMSKILEAMEKTSVAEQKRLRQGLYPKLKEALSIWLSVTVVQCAHVFSHLFKHKAETLLLQLGIEGFKFSDSWFRNFKKQYDLTRKKVCSESGAVNSTLAANYRSEKLEALLSHY